MDVSKIIRLPVEDSGYQCSIVRFHNSMIDSTKRNRVMFFRREAILIVNGSTKRRILRYAMGNSGIAGLTKAAIAIDYDAVDELGLKFGVCENISARRARQYEVLLWFWSHKDLNVRLSMRLAVLGVILGTAGLIAGFF